MNWKLIFKLSLFGLAMGIATVFFIPSSKEPAVWLVIFIFCAYILAKRLVARHFVHGVLLGLANSVWITVAHILLFSHYIATHQREAAMMTSMPLAGSPRLMMALTGPVVGFVSGLVIGLFALFAGKFFNPAEKTTPRQGSA